MSLVQAEVTQMAPSNPANLLQIAVERGADVEQLGKLMDLQERWSAAEAKKAFFSARAKFQSKCPTIKKDKEVSYGNTKYSYATLAGIAEQIREPMEACGLTYRFEIADTKEEIKVSCLLSHVDGHTEINTMTAAPDDSGAKNEIQQRGSAVSYLQRYTLIGALGIASAVEDDDGGSTGATNVEQLRKHNDYVRDNLESIVAIKNGIAESLLEEAAEAWAELDQDTQRGLWLAPTKGGIFTTLERQIMKSDEWNEARKNIG